jgi:hypothetical protein
MLARGVPLLRVIQFVDVAALRIIPIEEDEATVG